MHKHIEMDSERKRVFVTVTRDGQVNDFLTQVKSKMDSTCPFLFVSLH